MVVRRATSRGDARAIHPATLGARANNENESNPLARISPHMTADEDARLMIAAVKARRPCAPRASRFWSPTTVSAKATSLKELRERRSASRILREERFAARAPRWRSSAAQILAAIHRITTAEVAVPDAADAAEHIAAHRRIVENYGLRLPAIELGLRWAEQNVPRNARHTVLHGDFRAGNLIVGEDGIRCVLDWELAQSGDPMQDLGWLCVKTWRFGGQKPVGGFGTREDLFDAYEKAERTSVDPAHVRFWEAFGSVQWAFGCLALGTRGVEEVGIERCAIGRRVEEPLWDFFNLIEGRD